MRLRMTGLRTGRRVWDTAGSQISSEAICGVVFRGASQETSPDVRTTKIKRYVSSSSNMSRFPEKQHARHSVVHGGNPIYGIFPRCRSVDRSL
jgi:hypothetical protein